MQVPSGRVHVHGPFVFGFSLSRRSTPQEISLLGNISFCSAVGRWAPLLGCKRLDSLMTQAMFSQRCHGNNLGSWQRPLDDSASPLCEGLPRRSNNCGHSHDPYNAEALNSNTKKSTRRSGPNAAKLNGPKFLSTSGPAPHHAAGTPVRLRCWPIAPTGRCLRPSSRC